MCYLESNNLNFMVIKTVLPLGRCAMLCQFFFFFYDLNILSRLSVFEIGPGVSCHWYLSEWHFFLWSCVRLFPFLIRTTCHLLFWSLYLIQERGWLFTVNDQTDIEPSKEESPHHVVANVLDYDLEVCEFELKSFYYVHFMTDILGKCMNILILFVG